MNDEDILRRLNVMIGLLSELLTQSFKNNSQNLTDSKKFADLKRWGLENEEIGELFSRSSQEVAKLSYEVKRKKK